MTVNHTHNHTHNKAGAPTDLVAALHELGELHSVYAFAGTDALNRLDPQADRDELDAEIYTAETYLGGLAYIAAQFKDLDGEEAKHVLTGIHAAVRHRIAVQIHHARHHSGPDAAVLCDDPDCWDGETV